MGTQVLLDILMLAKCDHFLHADSSVAALASYFNSYMKSYFMEPGKFDKVCLFVCLLLQSVLGKFTARVPGRFAFTPSNYSAPPPQLFQKLLDPPLYRVLDCQFLHPRGQSFFFGSGKMTGSVGVQS